jgi:bacterioferritin-associated ferredoxin
VRTTIEAGACSLHDLAERCGAGSRCGGCHAVLSRMLAEVEAALGPLGVPAAACAA